MLKITLRLRSGRISALASMTRHVDFAEFLGDLKALDNTEAWLGAATVWTNAENIQQHRDQCFAGMDAGLDAGGTHAMAVARQRGQGQRIRAGA